MHRVLTRSTGVVLVADDVGEVLVQRPAARAVQDLDAAADREERQVGVARGRDERELELVAGGVRPLTAGVRRLAVVVRRDVGSAGEDKPVDRIEQFPETCGLHGQDERCPARPLDRRHVGDRGGDAPGSPPPRGRRPRRP